MGVMGAWRGDGTAGLRQGKERGVAKDRGIRRRSGGGKREGQGQAGVMRDPGETGAGQGQGEANGVSWEVSATQEK